MHRNDRNEGEASGQSICSCCRWTLAAGQGEFDRKLLRAVRNLAGYERGDGLVCAMSANGHFFGLC
jgi:hypothetical protein